MKFNDRQVISHRAPDEPGKGFDMRYRKEIDGLRAFAVLPVILFHAGFDVVSGGYVGVDVFFVISGFLITSILIEENTNNKFSIVHFYERRARRILPALFFVMLVCLPLAYLWMLPEQLESFAKSLVAVVFFVSNVFFWQESGYFSAASELKPLLHTWSLAVEEQYYLVFPIIVSFFWKFGRKHVVSVILALAFASFLLAEWSWRHYPAANFYLAPSRFWELLVGSVCAFIVSGKDRKPNEMLGALGLIFIVISILTFDESTPFPSYFTILPVSGAALIIVFADNTTFTGRFLSFPVFVAIGLISYSAYLWHQPILAFARLHSVKEPTDTEMLALIGLTMLLSWATWHWVEQPFRRKNNPRLMARSRVFGASGVFGVFFLCVGLFGYYSHGAPWRLSAAAQNLLLTSVPSPMRKKCHFDRNDDVTSFEFCTYFGSEAEVAILGNSHAVELAYAVAEELEKSSRSVAHFSISGCPPSFNRVSEPYCDSFFENRIDFILNNEKLSQVILAFRAEQSGSWRGKAIVDLANFLIENGKDVIVVVQAPLLQADISSYLRKAFVSGQSDIPARSRSEWERRNSSVYAALDSLHPQARVIDLADFFCDQELCYAIRNNTALYFDDDHMSIFGARMVAGDILRLMQ